MAQFSPDGAWLCYHTPVRGDVMLDTFPARGKVVQLSSQGGAQAQWRRDGKEIFYIGRDRRLMAVPITLGASPTVGAPIPLFQTRITATRFVFLQYTVAADGQRFLINSLPQRNAPLNLVVNWPAELKRR